MLLQEAVEAFLLHRRLRRVAPGTSALYRHWLESWLSWRVEKNLSPLIQDVSIDEIRCYLLYLSDEHIPHQNNAHRPACVDKRGLSAASVEGCWKVLRAFWRYMAGEKLLNEEQFDYFKGDRIPRPKVIEAIRQACDHETLTLLLTACDDKEEEGARNKAILLMLFESGMRIAELCSLYDNDIDLDGNMATVVGKGGQQRYVFWSSSTAAALQTYMQLRRGTPKEAIDVRRGAPLFRGCSSRNNGGPVTPNAVRAKIKRIAKQAKVTLPENAPVHWLRHGFARSVLDAGIDGFYLQQLMGHKRTETTIKYVRQHYKKLKEVHGKVYR